MKANSLTSEAVPAAWLKEHEVSFEIAPVHEHVKHSGLQQTGHSLVLFGRFDPGSVPDPVEVARSICQRLQTLALEALHDLPVAALVQVEPIRRATIPLEAPHLADALLTVMASPVGREQQLSPAELRRAIQLVEGRLLALGLKRR